MPISNPPLTVVSAGTYTVTGEVPDRTITVTAMTLSEVANVLGTLIEDLKAAGWLT